MIQPRRLFVATVLATLSAAVLVAVSPAPGRAEDSPAKDEPKSEPVTKGPFAVVLDLTGVFDAKQSWEVMLDAEQWAGEPEVAELAAPGLVEKGQTLVRFKSDKIDEALVAAERDLVLSRDAFQKQTDDVKRQDELKALSQRRAELDLAAADLALKRFQEQEKGFRLQEADQRLQNTKDGISDQEDELAQLEKMYKSDELVEATEEIVLKRAKRSLARSRLSFGMQQKRDESWRKEDLPREEESLQLAKRRAVVDFERFKSAAAVQDDQQKIEYERAKTALAKQEDSFAKLKRDREKFELKSPEAGLAVWGAVTKGKWAGGDPPTAAQIAAGRAKVKLNQVLFTIVKPGEVQVRTGVGEAAVFSVAEGQSAKVKAGPMPKTELAGKVVRVARVASGSEFEVLLDVAGADARLLPGHSCKVRLTTMEKPSALTVPSAAVTAEGEKRFVQVLVNGAPARHEVQTGDVSDGRTEILSGVNEGDRVALTAPKGK